MPLAKHEIMTSLRDMILCNDNDDIRSMALDMLLYVDRNMADNDNKPYFDMHKLNKVKLIKHIREYLHSSDDNVARIEIRTSEFSDKQYAYLPLIYAKLLTESILEYIASEHNS